MFDHSKYEFVNNVGEVEKLSDYSDGLLMIVNTASYCGFTAQYPAIENLYQKYKKDGFKVIAFPCNQFGNQEPGTNEDIRKTCDNYNVTFSLAAKIEVNGENAHPIYKDLRSIAKGGNPIGWNFEKFLITKSGQVLNYPPDKTMDYLDHAISEYLL